MTSHSKIPQFNCECIGRFKVCPFAGRVQKWYCKIRMTVILNKSHTEPWKLVWM